MKIRVTDNHVEQMIEEALAITVPPYSDCVSLYNSRRDRIAEWAARRPDPKRAMAALRAVNGRASSFTVHTANQLVGIANRAEKQLADAGVPKRARVGCSCWFSSAGPTANAYKYTAIGTQVILLRGTNGWYLIDAQRTELWTKKREGFEVEVSQTAWDAIVRKATRGFRQLQRSARKP